MKKILFLSLFLAITVLSFGQGNVGVGTQQPLSKLGVSGNLAVGINYMNYSAPSEGLMVEGQVVIGDSVPIGSVQLSVYSQINGAAAYFKNTNASSLGLGSISEGTLYGVYGLSSSNSSMGAAGVFDMQGTGAIIMAMDAGNEVFRVNDGGNVGIGISAPKEKLHLVSGELSITDGFDEDEGVFIYSHQPVANNAGGRIFFKENAQDLHGFSITYNGDNTNGSILNIPLNTFAISNHDNNVDGNIALAIKRLNGNVGIGIDDPTQLLHVSGAMRLEEQLYDESNSAGAVGDVLTATATGTSWVDASSLNTDNQTLSFNSPMISISGGNSIDISALNTDDQNLAEVLAEGNNGNNLEMVNINGIRVGSASSPGSWGVHVTGISYVSDYFRADGGVHVGGSSDPGTDNLIVDGNTGLGTTSLSARLMVDGWIGRTAHNNGALLGSYNNVGANSTHTSPIYIIGSSYKPTETALSNMYGIGYSHTNTSFIPDPGNNSWGMYVAADGDARIFLGASSGGVSYFNAGNLGLGTTSPSQKFHIYNGDQLIENNGSAELEIKDPGTRGNAVLKLSQGSDNLDRAVVNYNAGSSDLWYAGMVYNCGSPYDNYVISSKDYINNCNGLTHTAEFTIASNGNVGIGVNSPSYNLHVNGRIKSDGITESSDLRLKHKIGEIENALEIIESLEGVSYYWKKEVLDKKGLKDRKQIGLIAQDVEKVIPEIVDTDNEGYKSIQYSHMVPVLIEAVKKLSSENKELKQSLDDQKAELRDVNNLLKDWKSEQERTSDR